MKPFSQLTVQQVKILKETGLLWEIYPEANELFKKPTDKNNTCCQNGNFGEPHNCAKQPPYNESDIENIIIRYVNHYAYWQPKISVEEVIRSTVTEILKKVGIDHISVTKYIKAEPPTAKCPRCGNTGYWKPTSQDPNLMVPCPDCNPEKPPLK
jgi:hypothetical protein